MELNRITLQRKIFDHLINGIYIYDVQQGNNVYINKQYTELTGYTLEDIKSFTPERFFELFHPDDQQIVAEHMAKVTSSPAGTTFPLEYRFKKANGDWMWCMSHDLMLDAESGGEPNQFMGSFIDITDRKAYETELIKSRDNLITINKELEQFASIVSHDLQNPINNLLGFQELIKKRIMEGEYEAVEELVDYMHGSTDRMRSLISGLLEYAKLGSESMQREWIDCNELLDNLHKDLSNELKKTNAKVSYRELPKIYASRIGMREVFQNLITNSVKYKKEDHPPIINIMGDYEDGEWKFTLKDNGIGIKSNDLEKVFEMYGRTNGSSKINGLGIGLAQCKKIITSHNGEIWMESKVGQGTTVNFKIPEPTPLEKV